MLHWNMPHDWPTHCRVIQGHTVAIDLRWFGRALIDSRTTPELYHATSGHQFPSIHERGLCPGGVAGHRCEVHLCAAHPLKGEKCKSGVTLPVRASYYHRFRKDQDIILVYCMVTLMTMGIISPRARAMQCSPSPPFLPMPCCVLKPSRAISFGGSLRQSITWSR